ncbi:uncharacterized protein LOC128208348 [Mya arenaria]|uniref:uncharacterized protein LOC128208348 n=1 Tax=Mya arenaria TaxID=6604 RepID=UPI0022E88231|nr:uncharacterized protein LOC128208348 [Mya arenaria]
MMRVLLMSIAVCLAVHSSHQSAQFYGGSISFDLDDLPNGGVLAKMEIISGWVLGTGPCGPNCSRADVGRSTKPSRQMMETLTNDSIYFGNFTTDFKRGNEVIKPLHDRMLQNYTEVVLAVNEIAKWEQELLKFSFVVEPDVKSQDMNIKLNTTSRIMLPAIDKDNDFIKCVKAKYIEKGDLRTIDQPGIAVGTVDEGCQVTIEATEANGYKDDYYVAIPVTVRDMNRVPIQFGSMIYNSAQTAICSTSVQLIVHVLAHLVTPEFIIPTPSANHRFILYVGSNWAAKVFAKSSENSTITEFMVSGRNLEHYQTSEVKDTTNEHVKYIEISWTPEKSDVQSHIVCVTAIDENGVDSAEQRCFILEVIDKTFNHSSQIKSDRPYFIDAPSRDELVKCPVDATCVIPVFVVSKRNVTEIVIPESFMDESSIGDISYVLHNGQYVYKALLAFRHTMQGVVDICLQATDDLGMQSEKLCFKPMIKPPDPCGSSPCENSARCVSRDDATGLFDCHCDVGYYGIYCEKVVDMCNPSPCDHGNCFPLNKGYYCYCADDHQQPNDYRGDNCTDKIDDCAGQTCSNNGMCIDGVLTHTCDCFQRYTGNDCETDLCPGSTNPRTCPSAECIPPCNNSGVCKGGGCICTLGFEGNICENEKGNISRSLTGVSFVKPTLQTGSKIVCTINGNTEVQNCSFDVFMETESMLPPFLNLSTTESLIQSTSGPVHDQTLIAGVHKLYTSKISIIGHVVDKSHQYVCVIANDTTNPTAVDKLCLELDFQTTGTPLEDESLIRFLEPTPLAGSRLKCILNEGCTLFLYTSFNISWQRASIIRNRWGYHIRAIL